MNEKEIGSPSQCLFSSLPPSLPPTYTRQALFFETGKMKVFGKGIHSQSIWIDDGLRYRTGLMRLFAARMGFAVCAVGLRLHPGTQFNLVVWRLSWQVFQSFRRLHFHLSGLADEVDEFERDLHVLLNLSYQEGCE